MMRAVDSVLSVFPPPAFLSLPTAGIAFSEGSVKCVLLTGRSGGAELDSYTHIPVPQGAIVNGDIEMPEKIVEILRTLRLRFGVRYANASLSERKAFLYEAIVPGPQSGLRAGIEFDLESHVPLPPAETVFDFEAVKKVEAGTVVAVTAYAKRITDMYQKIFIDAGITLRALEVESQSLVRAVVPEQKDGAVMVVDVGGRSTRIVIAERGIAAFSATLDIGGDAFTAAVMKLFNVEEAEAQKIQSEGGFFENGKNNNLVEALMITASVLKDEIIKNLAYWNAPDDGLSRAPIGRIILSGGNANLRGFPEYVEGAVGIPVSLANVWENVLSLNHSIPSMPFAESLRFTQAIGLAARQFGNQPW